MKGKKKDNETKVPQGAFDMLLRQRKSALRQGR